LTRLPLALSLGDPAGVGPELIAEAWTRRAGERLPPFFVVGGARCLVAAARARGLELPVAAIGHPEEAAAVFGEALPVLDHGDTAFQPGQPDAEGARLALGSLEHAADLVRDGDAAALVTAPVAKAALAAVGFAHPGQTEFLAARCGLPTEAAVMMLAGPSLRTVPLTIHCALAEVPHRLSAELIVTRGRIVAEALIRDFGLAMPRLAVCGLNPHAGEQGAFGDEEARIIGPAILRLRAEGVDATGPHAADALFAPHKRASFDAALCMYHDQALIPVKALDFDQGVNVTLGLPIVRTSPDHGTAFDIAGTGVADPGPMIAAIRMAADMAARRAGS
jgi:4-hydroxythreonine-4-phosphate dehydrogenase